MNLSLSLPSSPGPSTLPLPHGAHGLRPGLVLGAPAPAATPDAPMAWRPRTAPDATADAAFAHGEWARLNAALAASGGIVTADELADLLRRHTGQGLSQVARWLVSGELLCFRFLGQTQVPMFQFDPRDMTLRAAVQDAVAEMRGVFEGAELTRWFAEGNSWLAGVRPADHLGLDAPAVLAAARADRFIATGWS